MSRFTRMEPTRELVAVFDKETQEFIFPGTYHIQVIVTTKDGNGTRHAMNANLREGLLEEDERHLETVYRLLERNLEGKLKREGLWINE